MVRDYVKGGNHYMKKQFISLLLVVAMISR